MANERERVQITIFAADGMHYGWGRPVDDPAPLPEAMPDDAPDEPEVA